MDIEVQAPDGSSVMFPEGTSAEMIHSVMSQHFAPPEMGSVESGARGFLNATTFGLAPAIEGLGAAAGPDYQQTQLMHDVAPVVGAAKMLHSYFAGHPDDQVRKDYEAGRQAAEETEKQAGKSWAYTGGQVVGSLLTPVPGLGAAGGLGARLARGAAAGAVGGGLYGAGSAISSGMSAPSIGKEAAIGAGLGGAAGGVLGGVLGPRLRSAELPLNVQAAQAAQGAGASLPVGLVSPNPITRATTRIAESLPLVGPGITERAGKSIEAAGEQVGDIASSLRGDATSRADVGEAVRPGLTEAIANNKDAMSAEYDGVRNMFDTQAQTELPETKAALDRVLAQRSKLKNPMQGLDNIAELVRQPAAPEMGPTVLRGMQGLEDQAAAQPWGATFDELQRTRSDFGRATKFGEPNPGYSEGERKFLYGAMSRDMENIARQGGGEQAVAALKTATGNAQQYIEQNAALQKLVNKSSNEGLAGTLMGTAAEKTGNIGLLKQLKAQLPQDQFQMVSGQLLTELGHNPSTNSFSLSQFASNWSRLNPQAKGAMFDPGHQKILDGLAGMGKFLKSSEKYRNVSGTAHGVAWLDILEHVADSVGEAFTGNFKPAMKTVAGMGMGAFFGKALARPASASAIARWTRAAQDYGRGPSVAKQATLNLATRNLVNNLADLHRSITGPQQQ